MWVYRAGIHNQIVNALSWKEVMEFVRSLSRVVADVTAMVKHEALQDSAYNKLVEQVKEGTTRQYWLEDKLLYYVGRKLFVPSNKL